MKMKSNFEIADGKVKIKSNNLNAIKTIRPTEFIRESETFNALTSNQKTLLNTSTHKRDSNIDMLFSKYTTYVFFRMLC